MISSGMSRLLGSICALAILAGCAYTPEIPSRSDMPRPELPRRTSAPEAVPGRAVVAPVEQPQEVAAGQIYFAAGSAELNPSALQSIRRHAEKLMENTRLSIILVGFTDDLGSREYNVALSQKRVAAVAQALQNQGIKPRRIRKLDGDPEKAITGPCRDEACRQSLRRVEVRYLEKADKPE